MFADKDSVWTTLWGDGTIEECLRIEGQEFVFDISPRSFFQTNTTGCEVLYSTIAQMMQAKPTTLLDLYCGTGTIGMIVSSLVDSVEKLVGVELVESAVQDAYANASKNNI